MRNTWVIGVGLLALNTARADLSQFNSDFGSDFAAARASASFSDDLSLARRMLSTARRSSTAAGYQHLLCEKAFDLSAAQPSGFTTAAEALEVWVKGSPEGLDPIALAARGLAGRLGELSESNSKAVGRKLLAVRARLAELYDGAGQATQARRVRSEAEALAVSLGIEAASSAQPKGRSVAQLQALLETDPNNQEALREVLVHLVVLRDDPAVAGRYSEKVNDPLWRVCVPLAAGEADELSEADALRLGKWYRSLALRASGRPKTAMLARAELYYTRYLEVHGRDDSAGRQAATLLDQLADQRQSSEKEFPLKAPEKRGVESATIAKTADIRADLLLHMTFDGDSQAAPKIPDGSGLDQAARLVEGSVTQSQRGGALVGRVEVADSPSLRHEGSFTLAMWVRVPRPVQTMTLIEKEPATGAPRQFTLGFRGSDGGLFTYAGEGGGRQVAGEPGEFDAWCHVVISCAYDGRESRVTFYRNGKPAGSDHVAGRTTNAPSPLRLGHPEAAMDDVRVYGRALSALEASAIYSADGGRGVDPKGLLASDDMPPEAMEEPNAPSNAGSFFGLSVD